MIRSLALVAALGLAACGTALEPQTLGQRFFVAVDAYTEAKAEAALFVSSAPLCTSGDAIGCIPPDLVIKIDDVTDELDPQIEAAVDLMVVGELDASDQRSIIRLTRSAIRQLAAAQGGA